MRAAILSVLLLAGCKGTDLAPDEFRLDYTRGWADNNFDHRNVDFATDSDAVTVGFSWYLGRTASDREAEHQAEQLTRMTNLLADALLTKKEEDARTVTVQTPAPAPAPTGQATQSAQTIEVNITTPAPTPEPAPEPEKAKEEPAAKPDEPDKSKPTGVTLLGIEGPALEMLLYALGALILTIVAVIKRKVLIEGAVTVKRKVQERGRDREAVKRRLQEGMPPKKDDGD